MKKNIIICIIIFIVLVVLVFLPSLFTSDNNLVNALQSYGFKDTGDGITYTKLNSSSDFDNYTSDGSLFDTLYFNLDSLELKRNIMEVTEDTDVTFNSTYSYTNNSVVYLYKIIYDESNIILSGEYSDCDFSCNIDFIEEVEIDDIKEQICDDAKNYSIQTYDISNSIFNDKELKYINKKTGN